MTNPTSSSSSNSKEPADTPEIEKPTAAQMHDSADSEFPTWESRLQAAYAIRTEEESKRAWAGF